MMLEDDDGRVMLPPIDSADQARGEDDRIRDEDAHETRW